MKHNTSRRVTIKSQVGHIRMESSKRAVTVQNGQGFGHTKRINQTDTATIVRRLPPQVQFLHGNQRIEQNALPPRASAHTEAFGVTSLSLQKQLLAFRKRPASSFGRVKVIETKVELQSMQWAKIGLRTEGAELTGERENHYNGSLDIISSCGPRPRVWKFDLIDHELRVNLDQFDNNFKQVATINGNFTSNASYAVEHSPNPTRLLDVPGTYVLNTSFNSIKDIHGQETLKLHIDGERGAILARVALGHAVRDIGKASYGGRQRPAKFKLRHMRAEWSDPFPQ
ncbi:hypothetical protein C8R45DRAFT_936897 [Mycena sanguinolenta]|nr:hypothetical protein C8R45DRAFT_936897 [Mycena sanguinolenta]